MNSIGSDNDSNKNDGKELEKMAAEEIKALHDVFVSWFKGAEPREYLRQELLDRLIPMFSHVAPNGQNLQGRSTLIHNLVEKYGCYKDNIFDIEISNVKLIWATSKQRQSSSSTLPQPLLSEHSLDGVGLCMLIYEEYHVWRERNGDMSKSGRLSSCLLRERNNNNNSTTITNNSTATTANNNNISSSTENRPHNFHWVHVHETWLDEIGNAAGNSTQFLEGSEHTSNEDILEASKHDVLSSSTATGWTSLSVHRKKGGLKPVDETNSTEKTPAAVLVNDSVAVRTTTQLLSVPTTVTEKPNTSIQLKSNSSEQEVLQDANTSNVVTQDLREQNTENDANYIAQQNALVTQQVQQQQLPQIVQQHNVSLRRHFSPQLAEYAKPFMMGSELLGISINGWDIGTSQGPIGDEIWSTKALKTYENLSQYKYGNTSINSTILNNNGNMKSSKRKLNLPEMVFPAAHVALEHRQNNIWISWDVLDALDDWAKAHQFIPVEVSSIEIEEGNNYSKNGVTVLKSMDKLPKAKEKNNNDALLSNGDGSVDFDGPSSLQYDWTFSSPFSGAVDGGRWEKMVSSGIDAGILKDKSQPILFFDEIVLYEDDLNGNGQVQFSIKIRVMPKCTFLLARMWVRVDNVLLRLRETRISIEFAASNNTTGVERTKSNNKGNDNYVEGGKGESEEKNDVDYNESLGKKSNNNNGITKSAMKVNQKYIPGNDEKSEGNHNVQGIDEKKKSSSIDKIYRDVTWRECKWEELSKYKLPTSLRVWCREGNNTPALASLLSRLPRVDTPSHIYRHSVLKTKK